MKIVLDEYDSLRVDDLIGERWLSTSDLTDQIVGNIANNQSLILTNRDVLEVIDDIRFGLERDPETLEVVIPDNSLAGLLDTMSLSSYSEVVYITFNSLLNTPDASTFQKAEASDEAGDLVGITQEENDEK